MIRTLITHSGAFHADDVLAYLVLHAIHPAADLLRTRDQARIDAARDAIVFDVGNVYDADVRRFDHHQLDRAQRDDGLPYSALGLVWQHYGVEYLVNALRYDEAEAEEIHRRFDQTFVRDIDALDNGLLEDSQRPLLHAMALPALIGSMRPDFDDDDPRAEDHAFIKASLAAEPFFEARIREIASNIRSEKIVKQAIEERSHPNWIELPRAMDYLNPILESGEENMHFVINPSGNEWRLNVVQKSPDSFEARKDLPADWAGKRDAELSAVTGVEDARFCHIARFIAVADSRDGIMRLLQQALR